METWAGFCPGLHLSLGIWLLIAAQTLQHAKAEITCASCASPVQLHVEELELGRPMSTDPTGEPGTLKHIRLEFRELAVPDQNTGVDADHETVVSVEDVPQFPQHVSLIGVSAKEDASGSSEVSPRGSERAGEPEKSEGAALRRAKRSGPEFSEFSENGRTGRTSMDADAPEDRGSLFDGHKQGKSGFRWNRDEARGNNRQDEPKLTSSTFSLSGDSAHNHAVVYWSGQNSSVSNPLIVVVVVVFVVFPSSYFAVFVRIHIWNGQRDLSGWVTHGAQPLCSLVRLSCGPLLTGALEARCAPTHTARHARL